MSFLFKWLGGKGKDKQPMTDDEIDDLVKEIYGSIEKLLQKSNDLTDLREIISRGRHPTESERYDESDKKRKIRHRNVTESRREKRKLKSDMQPTIKKLRKDLSKLPDIEVLELPDNIKTNLKEVWDIDVYHPHIITVKLKNPLRRR
ncbi:MAG TPA: hypothetical protein VLG38_02685 [Gammaproteobacteria bacterium]|nr:hypothetical protein [Gammaproteobacteria bacterium]